MLWHSPSALDSQTYRLITYNDERTQCFTLVDNYFYRHQTAGLMLITVSKSNRKIKDERVAGETIIVVGRKSAQDRLIPRPSRKEFWVQGFLHWLRNNEFDSSFLRNIYLVTSFRISFCCCFLYGRMKGSNANEWNGCAFIHQGLKITKKGQKTYHQRRIGSGFVKCTSHKRSG